MVESAWTPTRGLRHAVASHRRADVHHLARLSIRRPVAVAAEDPEPRRDRDARRLHRRRHHHLQHRQRGRAPAVAVPSARTAGVSLQQLSPLRRRRGRVGGARLLRLPRGEGPVRGGGAVQEPGPDDRRRRGCRAPDDDDDDAVAVPAPEGDAADGAGVYRGGRRGRQRPEDHPRLRTVAAADGRQPVGGGERCQDQRGALHSGRRHAGGVPVLVGRHRRLDSRRLQRTGTVGRVAPRQQPADGGAAEARCQRRPGSREDRRPRQEEPRAPAGDQADPHRRRVPDGRAAAPGVPGARRPGHVVSAVGRVALRAADRLCQHRQPGAGPGQRPDEGTRHAVCARREPRAPGPPDGDRGGRCRGCRRRAGSCAGQVGAGAGTHARAGAAPARVRDRLRPVGRGLHAGARGRLQRVRGAGPDGRAPPAGAGTGGPRRGPVGDRQPRRADRSANPRDGAGRARARAARRGGLCCSRASRSCWPRTRGSGWSRSGPAS